MSSHFEVVAHRGVTTGAPENTLAAFEDAVSLGVDGVELDVRLSRDGIPVVYHYFYLDEVTDAHGPVFAHTLDVLRTVNVLSRTSLGRGFKIATLEETLHAIGGRIGLEIEMKGPEPEAVNAISSVLERFRSIWETIEVTSYEPALLRDIQERCPGLATDLLLPLSDPWMRSDVCAYNALHRGRLARARAVHLHPSQLSGDVVDTIRDGKIEVHAWGVNDRTALELADELGIPKVCTDRSEEVLHHRKQIGSREEPTGSRTNSPDPSMRGGASE